MFLRREHAEIAKFVDITDWFSCYWSLRTDMLNLESAHISDYSPALGQRTFEVPQKIFDESCFVTGLVLKFFRQSLLKSLIVSS